MDSFLYFHSDNVTHY